MFYSLGLPTWGVRCTTGQRDRLFVVDTETQEFLREFRVFPSMALDVLDAAKIAISHSRRPDDSAADDEDADAVGAYDNAYARRTR